ncbi:MAG: LysR family transcriptional regulator [Bacillota bacterium]
MEIRQLKTFVAVATNGSFTRAAETLDYAQSSVTAQVQSLEAELSTRLFERLGRKVVLTEDGEKLLKYADRILKLTAEAREVIKGASVPRGTLCIGAPESLCVYRLPELLQKYRKTYPQVEIILRSGSCQDFIRWLKEGSMDVAFFLQRETEIPELVLKNLVPEPLVILAWPGHPLTKKESITPLDMDGENLIQTENGCSYRSALEDMLKEAGVRPASVTEFGSMEAIKKSVMAGLGIALLPLIAVEAELSAGLLKELRWSGPGFNMVTQLSFHKDKWISPALNEFIKMTGEMIEKRPEGVAAVSGIVSII